MWFKTMRSGRWQLSALFLAGLLSASVADCAAQENFTLGASVQEVQEVMGEPIAMTRYPLSDRDEWQYGPSRVVFEEGRVAGWCNGGNLKVTLGDCRPDAPLLREGCSREDVVAALGTPRSINRYSNGREEVWRYGLSTLTFSTEGLVSWSDGRELAAHLPKAVVEPVEIADRSEDRANEQEGVQVEVLDKPLTCGTSETTLLQRRGSPDRVESMSESAAEAWWYGSTCFVLRQGSIVGVANLEGLPIPRLAKSQASQEDPLAYFKRQGPPTFAGVSGYGGYGGTSLASYGSCAVAENGSYYGQISEGTGRPKTVFVQGYFRSDGTYVRSHYRSLPGESCAASTACEPAPSCASGSQPFVAENGSYFGQISDRTGCPKTTYVGGYFRRDGTYVRSHYRSR